MKSLPSHIVGRSSLFSRRGFLGALAAGAGAGIAVPLGLRRLQDVKATGLACATPTKTLLSPRDFTLLGYYDVQTNGLDTSYAQGLTHRYVNGDLRFLNYQLNGQLHEFSLAGRQYGSVISSTTNQWNMPGANMSFIGLWWDEPGKRLWTTTAVDYTANMVPVQISTRSLNADGSVTLLSGPIGLSGIYAKRAYGGAQPVPSWFQTQYGVGPYVVGWGGYTSLMTEGGTASLGPTMYAIPDPSSYSSGSQIPTNAFKTIMDCAGATGPGDWYKSGHPSSYDRGVRATIPVNYFDGGDSRPNPSTRPTVPPVSTAQWLSPAPDGLGRFVWGDSYYNTGCWIDGPNKHGFIMIACLGSGSCWYQSSSLAFDGRCAELHIFDPSQLGQAASGNLPAWNVKPVNPTQLTLPGLGTPWAGDSPVGNAAAATYDASGGRLYIMAFGINNYYSRLYAFSVNA